MARSKRHTPIVGNTTAASDKPTKVAGHRRERAAVRAALAHDGEPPHPKVHGNPWQGEKDGKHWLGERSPESMRK